MSLKKKKMRKKNKKIYNKSLIIYYRIKKISEIP